ncbi:unnamed protein product, partial [Meganyctiphanes norvegica]
KHLETIMKQPIYFVGFCAFSLMLYISYMYSIENNSASKVMFKSVNHSQCETQTGCFAHNSTSSTGRHVGSSTNGEWGRKALLQSCYTYSNCTATNICCDLHTYTAADITKCAEVILKSVDTMTPSRLSIVLVGDSRTRQIFTSLAHLLIDTNMTYSIEKEGKSGELRDLVPLLFVFKYHDNIRLVSRDSPLNITFYHDPLLESWLPKLLKQWVAHPDTRPHLLQIGSGVHYLVFKGEKAFKMFSKKWSGLLPSLRALANNTHAIVKIVDHVLVEYHTPDYAFALADESINLLNSILTSLLRQYPNNILFWNSSMPLSDQYVDQCYKNKVTTKDHLWMCNDPMHLGYFLIHQFRNEMLNSFCNKYLQLGDTYCI